MEHEPAKQHKWITCNGCGRSGPFDYVGHVFTPGTLSTKHEQSPEFDVWQAGRLQGLEEAAKKLDFEGHTCNTPNYTDGPCYACAKEKLMEWVFERYENCVKISDEKTGKDRAGWLEDADHFMLILQLFKAAAIREKIAGEG